MLGGLAVSKSNRAQPRGNYGPHAAARNPASLAHLCERGREGTVERGLGGRRSPGLVAAAMRCHVGRRSGRAHGAARALDRGQRVCARSDVGYHVLAGDPAMALAQQRRALS